MSIWRRDALVAQRAAWLDEGVAPCHLPLDLPLAYRLIWTENYELWQADARIKLTN